MGRSQMRQAVVLVGGKGTRLGDITRDTPKPLLRISGEHRFLDYLLADIAAHGLEEILLVAGHLGDQVEAAYHGRCFGEAEVIVVREAEPAGTGGALHHVAGRLDSIFLMSNGDSFFDIDYATLISALAPDDIGALALRQVDDVSRYGAVDHQDGRISRFSEKTPDRQGSGWISGGVYALTRDILSRINRSPLSIEAEVFPQLAAEGRLGCVTFDGYFIDIGLPDTLETARAELPGVAAKSLAQTAQAEA